MHVCMHTRMNHHDETHLKDPSCLPWSDYPGQRLPILPGERRTNGHRWRKVLRKVRRVLEQEQGITELTLRAVQIGQDQSERGMQPENAAQADEVQGSVRDTCLQDCGLIGIQKSQDHRREEGVTAGLPRSWSGKS